MFKPGDRVRVSADRDEIHHSYYKEDGTMVMVGIATMTGTVYSIDEGPFPVLVQIDGDAPNEAWGFKEEDLEAIK